MEATLPIHVPSRFKKGQRVVVVSKTPNALAWYALWTPAMSKLVEQGFSGVVQYTDPIMGVAMGGVYWPSCALELVKPEPVTLPTDVPAKQAGSGSRPARAPKPRTKSSEPKPWDSAPCTHLRWHLMGFMKEKLTMKITKYSGENLEPPKGVAELTFACVKCDTRMTMKVGG